MSAVENEVNGAAKAPKAKSEVETVTMSDGRQVEFVGKRKLLKDTLIGDDGSVSIRLDFRNGQTRLFVLPTALLPKFAGHGAEQKYGDETAGLDDVDDMIIAIDELNERIQAGEWSTRREGSGMAGTSVLIRALMEFSSRPIERVKEFLTGKTQAEKLALRNSKELKDIVQRLESEKLSKAAKVDTDSLLSAL